MATFAFQAIGTSWEIDTAEALSAGLRQRILDRVESFDRTYSRFRPDSLVTQIAAAPYGGTFAFPDDAPTLFDIYDKLYELTLGAVDPLVGKELELLGYDSHYSLVPKAEEISVHRRNPSAWPRDVRRRGKLVTTSRPLVFDIGAAGKGYLVDIIAGLLRDEGRDEYLIDASGDMRHSGPEKVVVGLEHPGDLDLVIGTVTLSHHALCASATNRRAWGDGLHHVLDARTGVPVADVVATWVIAEQAVIADGLATALFFVPAEQLAPTFEFSSVRMFSDGRAESSAGFEGELFT